jgi:RNA polymerase subunit RPABC4/transcription elongation factor Spt4
MQNGPDNHFKAGGACPPEELNQFRERYAADLQRCRATDRRCAGPILVCFLAGFTALVCAYVLSQHCIQWLLGTGIFLIVAGLIALAIAASALQRQLKCPACQNLFLSELGNFCPECGSAGLEEGDWLGARHCNGCGKNIRGGKNRNFKYKACSHCGLLLDEKGL